MKTKVKFNQKKRKEDSRNLQIWLKYSIKGIGRLEYYTGIRADKDQWDKDNQRMKPRQKTSDGMTSEQINNELLRLASRITELHDRAKALGIEPSIQYFKEKIQDKLVKTDENGFFEVFRQFIDTEAKAKGWTKGTITKLSTVCNLLKEFESTRRNKIAFSGIDQEFYDSLVAFLQNDKQHINSYILKNLKCFKWFMNWATKRGFNKNLTFREIDIDLKTVRNQNIIFLTWPELQQLYNMPIKQAFLDRTRDCFCFQCFTGLRYSDLHNLKKTDLKENIIQFTTIKTGETLNIPYNKYSQAIIEKYKDLPTDSVLPVISNQKYNDFLKELGKLAGFDSPETMIHFRGSQRIERTVPKYELLSSHTGRKTFVTSAIYLGMPTEVIMGITGHKDHSTMELYYKIVKEHGQREMNKFNI